MRLPDNVEREQGGDGLGMLTGEQNARAIIWRGASAGVDADLYAYILENDDDDPGSLFLRGAIQGTDEHAGVSVSIGDPVTMRQLAAVLVAHAEQIEAAEASS